MFKPGDPVRIIEVAPFIDASMIGKEGKVLEVFATSHPAIIITDIPNMIYTGRKHVALEGELELIKPNHLKEIKRSEQNAD